MIIQMYDDSRMDEVREVVLGVLLEHGFEYDRLKDADLKDINSYYLSKDGAFFVGIDNGRVVGTAGVRKLEENMCEIRRIYLKKEYRGKGNGEKLFLAALNFAEKNCAGALLKTDPALKKAINMYLKHGFSFVMKKDGYMYFEKRF
ncbi:GNAT family N-acetyltransferase [Methanosarcina mazei]|jgi:putative acetyltransferase|uniref:GNAT family acetyltransferase n=2 Tax=Methanosarcina mazei TaxID=2209 RepID=A0A0F8KAR5_METMZ|nr:GNAT family N-acetyltransferase [Methanosarcina mazei]AKB71870.1 acetyltransferase [Methanosarcina mazei C16]KKG16471.1 GNAT family acetyltransferase [Methanosarcina mazei]KKG32575.1 GNAT family acetyltransferase [Methanosarcina mazei]KKG40169.1 GNAT family acetyltransferase [Methanosarcina mazei]KKG42416.1 GNAT family acetyltransferase [Methanosarcina mazei]